MWAQVGTSRTGTPRWKNSATGETRYQAQQPADRRPNHALHPGAKAHADTSQQHYDKHHEMHGRHEAAISKREATIAKHQKLRAEKQAAGKPTGRHDEIIAHHQHMIDEHVARMQHHEGKMNEHSHEAVAGRIEQAAGKASARKEAKKKALHEQRKAKAAEFDQHDLEQYEGSAKKHEKFKAKAEKRAAEYAGKKHAKKEDHQRVIDEHTAKIARNKERLAKLKKLSPAQKAKLHEDYMKNEYRGKTDRGISKMAYLASFDPELASHFEGDTTSNEQIMGMIHAKMKDESYPHREQLNGATYNFRIDHNDEDGGVDDQKARLRQANKAREKAIKKRQKMLDSHTQQEGTRKQRAIDIQHRHRALKAIHNLHMHVHEDGWDQKYSQHFPDGDNTNEQAQTLSHDQVKAAINDLIPIAHAHARKKYARGEHDQTEAANIRANIHKMGHFLEDHD